MQTKQIKNTIVNGIKTYCQKNNFTDVLLGLSGGIDSALVLVLACEALGANHVHTLMMKTKYTSDKSILLAQKIAEMNNVHHQVIDIEPILKSYLKSFSFTPKNPLTKQNLQARIRGVIAMAYSNENGWLLLSCSNKSESAMGYCTLYGDTCGGISPIGDIYKTSVYKLAYLYNQEGKYTIPTEIINREPTAELANNQKDTDLLPPYHILDDILKNHIFDNQPISKEKEELVNTIKNKYNKTAFKRSQMPPVIPV